MVAPISKKNPSSSHARNRRHHIWTAKTEALLGTASDRTIAAELGINRITVARRRQELGIASFGTKAVVWTAEMDAQLGTNIDTVVAQKLDVTVWQVSWRRRQLNIPPTQPRSKQLSSIIAKVQPSPLPPKSDEAPTRKPFLVDQPQFRRAGGSYPDTEDKALTAFLERALAEAYSLDLQPIACPYCHSHHTSLTQKAHARSPRPAFYCGKCDKRFNRLTGTPLARLRHAEMMPAFVRLLSQQLPYEEACRRLGVDYKAIANWTKKFRLWLLQLDPSGRWEAKVLLGIKTRAYIQCPRCGAEGEKQFLGGSDHRGRRLICSACSTTFGVRDAELLTQQRVRLEILYDPSKVDTLTT
ncbi:DUF746 domain-containing protein [Collimonas pratensis]|uniref:Helix-turn-helix domain protein n=1 Tax=Collimonas pratensis TaxID=279113 RepID=A0A127Q6Z6_9BURK|nr:DUF746 domain-containing protein [Collimonas pratensis]AMP05794.1 helix-turn-helix domain protein [Collimonas pratensis]